MRDGGKEERVQFLKFFEIEKGEEEFWRIFKNSQESRLNLIID